MIIILIIIIIIIIIITIIIIIPFFELGFSWSLITSFQPISLDIMGSSKRVKVGE